MSFSDETQVVIDDNKRVCIWRRPNEIWRPECLGVRENGKYPARFWGCVIHEGFGTYTDVDGNMKYQILVINDLSKIFINTHIII